jgi:hypothetical protein
VKVKSLKLTANHITFSKDGASDAVMAQRACTPPAPHITRQWVSAAERAASNARSSGQQLA